MGMNGGDGRKENVRFWKGGQLRLATRSRHHGWPMQPVVRAPAPDIEPAPESGPWLNGSLSTGPDPLETSGLVHETGRLWRQERKLASCREADVPLSAHASHSDLVGTYASGGTLSTAMMRVAPMSLAPAVAQSPIGP
jgi:hypothetical protein